MWASVPSRGTEWSRIANSDSDRYGISSSALRFRDGLMLAAGFSEIKPRSCAAW